MILKGVAEENLLPVFTLTGSFAIYLDNRKLLESVVAVGPTPYPRAFLTPYFRA